MSDRSKKDAVNPVAATAATTAASNATRSKKKTNSINNKTGIGTTANPLLAEATGATTTNMALGGAAAATTASGKRRILPVTANKTKIASGQVFHTPNRGNANNSLVTKRPATVAAAAAVDSSSPGGGSKKRPYRRTRRPANYCDKSTVTTFTAQPEAITEGVSNGSEYCFSNAFDIVMQESNDLMQAAMEAQQLGRLKMASTYLLLLHARLVGLGKRFDKAHQQEQVRQHEQQHEQQQQQDEQITKTEDSQAVVVRTPDSPPSLHSTSRRGEMPFLLLEQQQQQPSSAGVDSLDVQAISTSVSKTLKEKKYSHVPVAEPQPHETPKTLAAKQLASMLPSNIEMDQAMMEHLAKAAAQLHAARSSKSPFSASRRREHNYSHDEAVMVDAHTFLKQTANQQGMVTSMNALGGAAAGGGGAELADMADKTTSVSFSSRDLEILQRAHDKGGPWNIPELAVQLGRPEVQVKAYLRNLETKTKLAQNLQSDLGGQMVRGRKPTTTAMNTVPNAVCDARTLLRGRLLINDHDHHKKNDDSNDDDQDQRSECGDDIDDNDQPVEEQEDDTILGKGVT